MPAANVDVDTKMTLTAALMSAMMSLQGLTGEVRLSGERATTSQYEEGEAFNLCCDPLTEEGNTDRDLGLGKRTIV